MAVRACLFLGFPSGGGAGLMQPNCNRGGAGERRRAPRSSQAAATAATDRGFNRVNRTTHPGRSQSTAPPPGPVVCNLDTFEFWFNIVTH